eukprot:TRINITY_DN11837_c0_g1_i1.p5 TRINITY_DN11837_c0_g1~~TRINITY_DN11837_c0_g1_i1.p5  ORF type:complete len:112 (-),score=8.43 TRINITY_DN11837_c0_g1_i1:69-404(-)
MAPRGSGVGQRDGCAAAALACGGGGVPPRATRRGARVGRVAARCVFVRPWPGGVATCRGGCSAPVGGSVPPSAVGQRADKALQTFLSLLFRSCVRIVGTDWCREGGGDGQT